MITIQGKAVSEGLARGPLHFLQRRMPPAAMHTADPAAEKARLAAAREKAVSQLETLAEKCRADAGDELATLFETHAMLAQDEDMVNTMESLISSGDLSAEYAALRAGEILADTLGQMDDEYMRARAADIRDVARRICDCLGADTGGPTELNQPVIIAADDLSPSETLQLDREMILGFITRQGSANSHTAILARALGIPAICGAGDALREEYSGRQAYIDGSRGYMHIDPDPATASDLDAGIAAQNAERRRIEAMRDMDDIAPDGRRLSIWCNIGSPADIPAVIKAGAGGIGLVRSEFLYLGAGGWPSEDTQYAAYRRILEAMDGKRVVVRTLDIGADKQLPYFPMPQEENPALGMRGIRVSLKYPDIFRTQLRALYRASAHGRLAIMFPMITSTDELKECRRICAEITSQLRSSGAAFDENVELGIMIETPAAALIADELAQHADFFSVGTNDLTQYLMACDRLNSAMEPYWQSRHPALLRSIRLAADAARKAGKWVGICGEAASDPGLIPQFLDMGIDEISVSPARVLSLRAALRKCAAPVDAKL